jgi:RHS repeat-associated protein
MPTISSVSSSTTATTATVTWTTGAASSSYVELGDTSGDYTLDDGSAAAVTSHSVTISGLVCGSTYYYQALSAVGASGAMSSPATFSTSTCSSGSGITLVGSTDTSGNSGSAEGFSVALPSGIEANDQILLTVTTVSSSPPPTPTGYTLVSSSTSGYSWDPRATVFRKTASSSESDPWIETGYTQAAASAAVYRGVSTTTPIDEVADTNANYVMSITSNPVTTSVPGEKLVLAEAAAAGEYSPPTWTAPTGWTQEANDSSFYSRSAGIADSPIQPLAGGTSAPTATNSDTDDPATVLLGLEPAAAATTTYSYDSFGDRTSTTVGSGSPSAFTYDQTGELVTATEAGESTYTYAYNGDGLRMSKTVDATTESYAWNPLSTSLLADGSTYFIYASDGVPLEQVSGTTVYYFLHDQLGSTRALTNSSGTVVATFTYDPYGNLLGSSGSVSTPIGFAGAYTDVETGFLYLVNRYYDPATEQFLSVDPYLAETGEPYTYTNGDPVNETDPDGQYGICSTILGAGIFGEWLGCDKQPNSSSNGNFGCSLAGSLKPGSSAEEARSAAAKDGFGIPDDYIARPVRSGDGWYFQPPGAQGDENEIRVMDSNADPKYPDGYVRQYDSEGRPIDLEGNPLGSAGVGQPETHFPLSPDGGEIPIVE